MHRGNIGAVLPCSTRSSAAVLYTEQDLHGFFPILQQTTMQVTQMMLCVDGFPPSHALDELDGYSGHARLPE